MSDSIPDNPYPVGSTEWCWLEAYGDMKELSELSSLSETALSATTPTKFVRLSPRRLGMKRRVALSLGTPLGLLDEAIRPGAPLRHRTKRIIARAETERLAIPQGNPKGIASRELQPRP